MPTVVVARCFLDGEYTTEEVEVCFTRRSVSGLQTDLMRMFPRLDKRYTNSLGESSYGFAFVRSENDQALAEDDVVRPADRLYLIPTIGC